MDIQVQENPLVEPGDLIFVDDMVRGRTLMIVRFGMDVMVDGKSQHHRYALVDIKNYATVNTFRSDADLQKWVDSINMSTVYKARDFSMNLRKK